MKKLWLIGGFILLALWSCTKEPSRKEQEYTFQVMETVNGYGYRIYKNEKLYINQPHIPGVSGLKGFDTREQARIAAGLVMEKIRQGIFPPTVTEEELFRSGAIE